MGNVVHKQIKIPSVLAAALLGQFFAIILTSAILSDSVALPTYSPFGESAEGSIANSGLLVIVAFAATSMFVWLARSFGEKILGLFLTSAVALATFIITLVLYSLALDSILGSYISFLAAFGVGIFLAFVVIYSSILRRVKTAATITIILVAAEVGVFFAISLDAITLIILPLIFAAYDIYAVYKGPLKKLITLSKPEGLTPLSVRIGDINIGVGDFAFYAMLPAAALASSGLGASIITIAIVNIGLLITLKFLSKSSVLPGLPIPITLGTLALLILLFYDF